MSLIVEKEMQEFYSSGMSGLMERLSPRLTPLWGSMNAQHVVEHFIFTLKVATGKLNFEIHTPPEKLPRYREFLVSNVAIMRNFKNPVMDKEQPPPLVFGNLEEAKEKFQEEWEAFESFFSEHPETVTIHPVFGPLNYQQWKFLHFKHFIHHFVQMGLTSLENHGLREIVR